MSNLFDNPETVEVIENIVQEYIAKVEIAVENGSDFDTAVYRQMYSLVWLLSTKTRWVIHDSGNHEATALQLNENYAVIGLWSQRVIGQFDVDTAYWNGLTMGFQLMFTAMVERELEGMRGNRGVWWTGKRFISEKDLK